jgi:hypothetical protein
MPGVIAEENVGTSLTDLRAAGTERTQGLFPWSIPIGGGNIPYLLTRPDLKHSGDSAKCSVHRFPINPIKLMR